VRSRSELVSDIEIMHFSCIRSTWYSLPIGTLGETASSSEVLLKAPVIRACWCDLGVEA
jgi:hypothetical protein